MKKNICIFLVLFAAIALTPAVAQGEIFELENDFVMGYSFIANDIAQTTRLGFNFMLTPSFNAGFMYQQAGTNYAAGSFLVFNYRFVDKVKAGIMIGRSGGNPSAGLVFGYDILNNTVKDLSTVLGVRLEYLIPNISGASIENGILGVTLGLSVGI